MIKLQAVLSIIVNERLFGIVVAYGKVEELQIQGLLHWKSETK